MQSAMLAWHVLILTTTTVVLCGTMALFIQSRKARAHPGPVLVCLILSSSFSMIFRACTHIMSPTAPSFTSIDFNHEVETNTTLILYWFTLYFASSTTFWYLMLAMDLISSLSNPFLPFQSNSLIHHMLAWPLAGVWCVLYDIAVYQQPKSVPEVHLRMVVLLPLYGSLIYILFALHAAEARSRQLTTTTHATTLRMAKLIVPYLVVFGASGMAHMGIFVADLYNGKPTGYSSYIDQLVGIVSTMVLFVRFYFDSGVCRRRAVNAPPNQSEGDLSTVVSPQDDNFSDYLRTTASPSEAPPLPRVQSTTNFNVDIAAELRKMVMDLTRMGIVSAAASEVSDDEPSVVSDRAPTAPDFTAVERKRITFWGGTAATVADALVFEDVAPTVFHSLRELAGIGQASYLHSFDSDENLREVCSEGKSGNIFYFTANRQFMVKSVPKEEFDTLRSILSEYYTYLVQNPSSHLCRYFGCHSITLPVGTRRMYFVVMQNLFIEGPPHQRYDLKGNTDRRQAIPSWDVEAKMRAAVMRQKIAKLMMDIDFSRIHQCISVSDADSTAVKTQLKRDIQFLAGLHIMDYSILVGVRYVDQPCVLRNGAAVPSKDGMTMYDIGIIDMLQRYNWRWTVQRWFLGTFLCKDMTEVSAVPPTQYGDRLIRFIWHSMFNQARRESRSSLFTNSTQPSGLTFAEGADGRLSRRPSGYLQFKTEGESGATPDLWFASNLSDDIIDIHDCVLLQETS
ncbi:hypothetical protein H310_00967 [Aphanomyces invadans]|uniref:PIPK domain-containing protein n=1 Tax=Aphanomyces invadans TaxID=157072 RepID=A0A024UR91_9STRA|nr:hypothetical protein H310_00967 [Aphanomyces invadans]ETW08372.1 hypothetical protein H310_00967 [Aphanomyces invadans]|eukprot:XP_008862177.1 hypothetical protein H310_00967 [Aphanomyces invadans]